MREFMETRVERITKFIFTESDLRTLVLDHIRNRGTPLPEKVTENDFDWSVRQDWVESLTLTIVEHETK